jgi:GTPase SAR1 family protein
MTKPKQAKKKSKQFDYTFKKVMIGDSGARKLMYFATISNDKFNENFYATIGVNFRFKSITIDNKSVKLQIVRIILYFIIYYSWIQKVKKILK